LISEPKLVERAEQPYVGLRVQVPMKNFKTVIPESFDSVFDWLEEKGIPPAGAPFVRYHVINMEADMDIEMGVPVAQPVAAEGGLTAGVLPAGRYASLVFTGLKNAIAGNAALLDWGAKQGFRWDTYDSEQGDGFTARVEFSLTDPAEEPDQGKWDTDVAIKLAD
jgi:effector-binding domain-containing protein